MIVNPRLDAGSSAASTAGPYVADVSAPGDAPGLGARIATYASRLPRGSTSALVSVLDQGVVSGFNFLAGIAVARIVDIEAFGRFALVMIVVSLAQNLHNALITAPMMTIVGTRLGRARAYLASLLVWSVILCCAGGGLVALVLAGLFSIRGEDLSLPFLAAAAALTATQNLQFTLRRLLFARAIGSHALAMDLARGLAFLAAALGWRLLSGTITVETLLWLLAGTALITSLLPLKRHLLAGGRGYHLGTVSRRHAPLARWLLPVVLVTFGQEQVVWIIAGTMLGDKAMGGLRASQYLVGMVLLMLSATENIIPVGAGRALSLGGLKGLHRYLGTAAALLGLPMIVVLAAMAAFAPLLMKLVFGPDFIPYASCLRVLALGVVFILIRDLATHQFRALQRSGTIFQAFAASFVVSVLLMYPLLSGLGLIGATVVVLIGHAVSMGYMLVAAGIAGRSSWGRSGPDAASASPAAR